MDAIFKRQFRRWAWDPAVTERVNSLRQQMLSTQRAREQRHADKGISLGDAISELKKYINGSTDEAVRKGRVTLNLVCKLTKGTNGGFRGYIGLPHVVPNRDERILVFCDEARVGDSLRAGAAVAGGAELVNDIVDGKLKFTRCLATPGMFPTVAKLARILGPMGLMPNLRHGTLTDDLVPAIGRALSIAPYRIVKESGVMNICIAEGDFEAETIRANVEAVFAHVQEVGTEAMKKRSFIQRACISAHKMHRSIEISSADYQRPFIKTIPPSVQSAPLQFAMGGGNTSQ